MVRTLRPSACSAGTRQAQTRVPSSRTEQEPHSPCSQAFVEAGAVQCGFCTPGLIVAADDLLRRCPDPAEADVREALAGNLCRCTGYAKILDAVLLAARRRRR